MTALNNILADARSLCGERVSITFAEFSDGSVLCEVSGHASSRVRASRLAKSVHDAWKAAQNAMEADARNGRSNSDDQGRA